MSGPAAVSEPPLQVGAGQEAIERIAAGEPAWRREQRERAWRAFEAQPEPDPRSDEDWRRTSLRGLALAERPIGFEGALTIEPPAALPDGVVLATLSDLEGEAARLWREHAFSTLAPERSKFVAAAEAFANAGAVLFVPDGVELEGPIVLRHEITGPRSGFGAFRHLVIVLGKAARAEVVLVDRCDDGIDSGVLFSATEVVLGDGASLTCSAVQALGHAVMRFESRRAEVGADACIRWVDAELGARLARAETESYLGAPGGEVQQRALVYGDDRQHIDLLNRVIHAGRHTTSDLRGRVALDQGSRSVYRGIVIMRNGCAGANSQQACNSVLLDDRARSDAIPSLFIDEDDVRAGHGATAGPLDENQIFYLMTRGLPRPVCEHLILEGFFAPVLERVRDTAVEPVLRELMERKLALRAATRGD
ncbi:MAG: SufD family Fe-S cluster assembly protein [Planctomycetota bacterium]|nr:MAG: SufD family Fe-S cluster assembly protein [Planctomycetota bacterium]